MIEVDGSISECGRAGSFSSPRRLRSLGGKVKRKWIYCDKNNKIAEQRTTAAMERLKKLVDDAAIRYKQNIKGVGGAIFIRGRKNFNKLAPYLPFHPRTKHMRAFYDGLR